MNYVLVGQLSRFLQSEGLEGESPTTDLDMMLPELHDPWYSVPDTSELDDHSFFTEFTHARRNAGRPIKIFQAQAVILSLEIDPSSAELRISLPYCHCPFAG